MVFLKLKTIIKRREQKEEYGDNQNGGNFNMATVTQPSDSILQSTKKLIGIAENYTVFDPDIITHINTVFFILYQLGVLSEAYSLEDGSEEWSDLPLEIDDLQMIKSYMAHKVRMLFDPPSGAAKESADNLIAEMEWRLNVEVDPKEVNSE